MPADEMNQLSARASLALKFFLFSNHFSVAAKVFLGIMPFTLPGYLLAEGLV